jgi:predicted membrane GTPase involved in stress response
MKPHRRRKEPYEQVTVDVEEQHQGGVMEKLGARGGDLKNMVPDGRVVCAWTTSCRRAA